MAHCIGSISQLVLQLAEVLAALYSTQLTLQFALLEWELQTAAERAASTDEEVVKVLQAALQRLTKIVSEAVANEAARYFEGVKAPDVHSVKNA